MSHSSFIPDAGSPQLNGHRVPGRDQDNPRARVEPAVQAIQANPEVEWTVESLAEVAKMSRSVFAELFHQAVGVPPGRFLLDCRMQRASELLRNHGLGIKEIAARVGYGSESSFGNAFKRWAGKPPGAFRAAEPEVGAAVPPPSVA